MLTSFTLFLYGLKTRLLQACGAPRGRRGPARRSVRCPQPRPARPPVRLLRGGPGLVRRVPALPRTPCPGRPVAARGRGHPRPGGGRGGGRASDEARVPRFPRGAALGAWNGRLIASLRLRPRVCARARCPGLRDPRGRAPPSPGPPERVRVGLGPGVLPSRGRGRRPCPRPLPGAASALPS